MVSTPRIVTNAGFSAQRCRYLGLHRWRTLQAEDGGWCKECLDCGKVGAWRAKRGEKMFEYGLKLVVVALLVGWVVVLFVMDGVGS